MNKPIDIIDRVRVGNADSNSVRDEIISLPTRCLGGLPITIATRQKAARDYIRYALAKRGTNDLPLYSTSANGQVLAMCADDEKLTREFLKADQILADGMPMVFYSKISNGKSLPERLATTDLFHDVVCHSQSTGVSSYFLGADEEVNKTTCNNVQKLYPHLRIAGRHHGYFTREEECDLVNEINDIGPDILWVAMGAPKEQHFVSRNIRALRNVAVIKTCGGLFDFLSNKRSRAPYWLQALGFEWAYRTALEPRRLGKRYLLTNHKAIKLLLTNSF